MDTNVAVVANGRAGQAGPSCVIACVDALLDIRANRCVLTDDRTLILDEYRRHLSHAGQPGPGDAFFKWLWDNQGNQKHCRRVPVTPHADRGFREFPCDTDLRSFHDDDRKFVAVARASKAAPSILNAADTDWWVHRHALRRHGVRVKFLCPELMQAQRARRGRSRSAKSLAGGK